MARELELAFWSRVVVRQVGDTKVCGLPESILKGWLHHRRHTLPRLKYVYIAKPPHVHDNKNPVVMCARISIPIGGPWTSEDLGWRHP